MITPLWNSFFSDKCRKLACTLQAACAASNFNCMKQKLSISVAAGDRGDNNTPHLKAAINGEVRNTLHSIEMVCGFFHNSALADCMATAFELGLDQADIFAAVFKNRGDSAGNIGLGYK